MRSRVARFSLPDCRWSLFMCVPRRSFSLLFSVSVRPCSVTRPSVFHLLRLISRRASPDPRPSARPAVCSFVRPGAQSDIKFYYPCYRSAHSPPLIRAPRSPPSPRRSPTRSVALPPCGHSPPLLPRTFEPSPPRPGALILRVHVPVRRGHLFHRPPPFRSPSPHRPCLVSAVAR